MLKRNLKILGIFIAFSLCFPLHSLYQKIPSFITSIVLPVNESIWEHMKILFGSILISGVIQKIIVIVKKEKINNICFSNFIAAISSIPIFLILFLPVYYIIGENIVVTIIIMFIAIVISELISYKIMLMPDFNKENKTIIYVIIVYIVFGILTYFPLKIDLFKDPSNNIYGIKND